MHAAKVQKVLISTTLTIMISFASTVSYPVFASSPDNAVYSAQHLFSPTQTVIDQ